MAPKFVRPPKTPEAALKDRPLCLGLEKYMNVGPVVAVIWEGLPVLRQTPGTPTQGHLSWMPFTGTSAFVLEEHHS